MKVPHSFRGLLYAPSTESELAILFGMLLPYLDPPMYIVEGEFQVSDASWPDFKLKILERKEWTSRRVEFEVKSATFVKHRHNPNDYDKIICWEDNWQTLSDKDKSKYKKFSNPASRTSLKSFLENNKELDIKNFVFKSNIHSKSIYRNTFFILRQGLNHFPELKKRVAKDYISYFKEGISFIQLHVDTPDNISIYISSRAIEHLKDAELFKKDISVFNPKISKRQKDFSFSISSLQEAHQFIDILNKHLVN